MVLDLFDENTLNLSMEGARGARELNGVAERQKTAEVI
ncbi:hypothetical protein CES85_3579 (plasmid) [Ochrobactrum quorumnocens]|uniref:Uncharacterized protein n=1 Tax=Ochrobactrum quorumnocens TaxID=271865 RepID=A0A248UNY8_9HYPH|nr:hypothetical protein CES85_3579 [[Ochrobactrum] quorumnocens]